MPRSGARYADWEAIAAEIDRSSASLAEAAAVESEPRAEPEELKLYFDYKSPFAYLAMEPAFDLPQRFEVTTPPPPFLLRIKGRASAALLGVEGSLLVPGCAALGEPARRFGSAGRRRSTTRRRR